MRETLEVLLPVLGVAGLLLYLLLSGSKGNAQPDSHSRESLEDLRATHYQYFPLIRQALSASDENFLRSRVEPNIAREAFRERRAVATKFLAGLHEDFTNLDRLGRMIASMSPVLDRRLEADRLKLTFKFRLVYAMVWLVLQSGKVPLPQFERLSGLIGQLAELMEQAVTSVNALPGEPLKADSRS